MEGRERKVGKEPALPIKKSPPPLRMERYGGFRLLTKPHAVTKGFVLF